MKSTIVGMGEQLANINNEVGIEFTQKPELSYKI